MFEHQILFVGAICAIALFVARFYAAREAVWKLQRAKLPMPEFRLLAGHFGALKEVMTSLPGNATIHTVMKQLSSQFPSGMFYINMWPFNGTWLIVTTPSGASQCQVLNFRKPGILSQPLEVVSGGPSLISMNGETWKRWRSLINPGFNPNYMEGLVPLIAAEVAVFCDLLRKQARQGKVFQLEEMALRLTVDTIGTVALDTRLHHQTQDNPLASALQRQVEWTTFGTTFNPFKRFLTIRPFILWYNNRVMDRLIGAEIEKRYAEHLRDLKPDSPQKKRTKSIMSLVLAKYLHEEQVARGSAPRLAEFTRLVAPQLRGFLFGGRNTTSSTLLYCYHLLFSHPKALAQIRTEHDKVFGTDPSDAYSFITQDPQRLNQLPYTTAVIKEVLRLFPPAASMREGREGVDLVDDQGLRYPTGGCIVWTLTLGLHHNARYWKDVEEFIPERWLVGPDDPLYPVKGAWRAFEFGPRACIGQTLAMAELKVTLVMTLREFDIVGAYEEWDRMFPREGVKVVGGNRAYQAEKGAGGAHPADGFPCRVMLRDGSRERTAGS